MDYIKFNVKPSNRVLDRFRIAYPQASFIARKWKSKVSQFTIPTDVYNANKETLKKYGTKSRD